MRTSEIIMLIFCSRRTSRARSPEGTGDGVEALAAEEGIQQAALGRVVIHDEEAGRGWPLEDFGRHGLQSLHLEL